MFFSYHENYRKKDEKSAKKYVNETNGVRTQMAFGKNFADRLAELRMIMEKETDPLKKEKMRIRLAFGILDFSDL